MRDHTVHLMAHPATPCAAISAITARVRWTPEGILLLDYRLEGDIARVLWPEPAWSRRADELWRHTCCELFLAEPGASAYGEANFSPSGEWALYRFTAYREGMARVEKAPPPAIARRVIAGGVELSVALDVNSLWPGAESLHLALTAVVEDLAGNLSYWALAHPPGKPDFHHPLGFALNLSSLTA